MSQTHKIYTYLLGLFLGAFMVSSLPAHAEVVIDAAPALQVQVPDSFRGAYLSAYYVIAVPPAITTNLRQYHVVAIKQVVTVPIASSVVQIPAAHVPVAGFFQQGFNFVLLVAHRAPTFTWINESDDSIPADPRGVKPDAGEPLMLSLIVKRKRQLQDLALSQGHPDLAILSF